MLEITCLFYYIISFGSLFLSHFYLRKNGNRFTQSFIFLFGLLGIYACLSNGWNHDQWIFYALASLLLNILLYVEAKDKPQRQYILIYSFVLILLLETLFLISPELQETQLRYTRPGITLLLTYSVTLIILQIQQSLQAQNKGVNSKIQQCNHRCFLIIVVAFLTYFNGMMTNFWDVITVIPGFLWAHAPYYADQKLQELQQRDQRIQQLLDQKKRYESLIKQNDAKLIDQEKTINQLTSRNKQLLSEELQANQKVQDLTGRAIKLEEISKEKELKIREQEQKINQLLQSEKEMQEQIEQLQNCLCSSEESPESVQNLGND